MSTVKVIGAGLAGSEAAWQLAQRGSAAVAHYAQAVGSIYFACMED